MKRENSMMPWPRTMRGPAQKPLLVASAMVTVSTGPGIKAPESPTRNELTHIPNKGHIGLWGI